MNAPIHEKSEDRFVTIDIDYSELPKIPEVGDDNKENGRTQRSNSEKPISSVGDWQSSEDQACVNKSRNWEELRDKNATYIFNEKTSVSRWMDPTEAKRSYSVPDSRSVYNHSRSLRRRELVRAHSKHSWDVDDIENLHEELLEQLQVLQANAAESGIKLPKQSQKYRPLRAPPPPKIDSPVDFPDLLSFQRRTKSAPADHRTLSKEQEAGDKKTDGLFSLKDSLSNDESSDEKEDSTGPRRALVRYNSTDKWQVNEIEDLHEDMMSQLEILQNKAVKSGLKIPRLNQKYKPAWTPPQPKEHAMKKVETGMVTPSIQLPPAILTIPEEDITPGTPSSTSQSIPPIPSSAAPGLRTPQGLAPERCGLGADTIISDEYLWSHVKKSGPRRVTMNTVGDLTKSDDNVVELANKERNRRCSMPVSPRTSTISLPSKRRSSVSRKNPKSDEDLYAATSDYIPEESDNKSYLELKRGDLIIVHKKKSSGWWLGKNKTSGLSGYFPGSFVVECPQGSHFVPGNTSTEKIPTDDKPTKHRGMWSGKKMHNRSQNLYRRQRSISSLSRRFSTRRKSRL